MFIGDTKECFTSHLGLWAMLREPLETAVSLARLGQLPVRMDMGDGSLSLAPMYQITERGDAVISMSGPFTKKASKFGGISTIETRKALREAAADPSVKRIVMHIESPGGHANGVNELAADIRAIKRLKPVIAYVDDLAASAAYFVASQANAIFANETANVGGLGTFIVLRDYSGKFEREGIKTIVVGSGGLKGAGAEGTELTTEYVEYVQGLVDSFNSHFKSAVKEGRSFSTEQTDKLFTGKVFPAEEAKKLGLIDGIASFEDVLSGMVTLTERVTMADVAATAAAVVEPTVTVQGKVDLSATVAAQEPVRETPALQTVEDAATAQVNAMAETLIEAGCPATKGVIVSTLLGARSKGEKSLLTEFAKFAKIPTGLDKMETAKPNSGAVTAEAGKKLKAELVVKYGFVDGSAKLMRDYPEYVAAMRAAAK